MSPRLWRRLAHYAAAGVVGTTLLAGASGAVAPAPAALPSRSDVVSSAHPTAADPTVRQETVRTAGILGLRPRVNAVATTSATCAGCRGDAVAVQVVEVMGGWRVAADNVATAWARCRGCTADAVSVQLVLLHRSGGLTTNNRALAVTGDCRRCSAGAAAYQIVLDATGAPANLDRLRDEVAAWAAQQPGATETAPRSRTRAVARRPQELLSELERQVTRFVDGAVLESRVAARTE